MYQILVISDTHVPSLQMLPEGVLQAIKDAELVVHCGDYVSVGVVEELRQLARGFIGVYGNVDPSGIRVQLPAQVTFTFDGKQIAVVHPHWGGHPDGLEEQLAAQFPHADAILFGHTHEPCNRRLNGTLLFNPGQAYPSFMVPASVGILRVSKEGLIGEILTLG